MFLREDVSGELASFKLSQAIDTDGIHPRVRKALQFVVATTPTHLFNYFLLTDYVPDDCRIANP